MPTQEDEKRPTQEKPKGPETPEQVATRAAGVVKAGKEKNAATVLAEADSEAPVAESAETDPAAQAREIAQKYVDQISREDRRITDPKQVNTILGALAREKKKLFQTADEIGNLSDLLIALDEGDREKILRIMRESADDPVTHLASSQFKQEVKYLPDTVRDAILAMICKEGKYNFADELRLRAERIEQQPERNPRKIMRERSLEVEASDEQGRTHGEQVRTAAVARFLEGIYPDLIQSDEVVLLREMWDLSYDQKEDRATVTVMVERYNQLHGDAVFSMNSKERTGGTQNGNEVLVKLRDGSIADDQVGDIEGVLEWELEFHAAQKATAAETK